VSGFRSYTTSRFWKLFAALPGEHHAPWGEVFLSLRKGRNFTTRKLRYRASWADQNPSWSATSAMRVGDYPATGYSARIKHEVARNAVKLTRDGKDVAVVAATLDGFLHFGGRAAQLVRPAQDHDDLLGNRGIRRFILDH
jgi:hypothetical protein